MREHTGNTYEYTRMTILAANINADPEDIGDRLDDIVELGDHGGLSKSAMLQFLHDEIEKLSEKDIRTMSLKINGLIEHVLNLADPERKSELFNQDTVRSQITATLLNNHLMTTLVGTGLTPMPFANNYGYPTQE